MQNYDELKLPGYITALKNDVFLKSGVNKVNGHDVETVDVLTAFFYILPFQEDVINHLKEAAKAGSAALILPAHCKTKKGLKGVLESLPEKVLYDLGTGHPDLMQSISHVLGHLGVLKGSEACPAYLSLKYGRVASLDIEEEKIGLATFKDYTALVQEFESTHKGLGCFWEASILLEKGEISPRIENLLNDEDEVTVSRTLKVLARKEEYGGSNPYEAIRILYGELKGRKIEGLLTSATEEIREDFAARSVLKLLEMFKISQRERAIHEALLKKFGKGGQ